MAELGQKLSIYHASYYAGILKLVTEDGRTFISTDFAKTWVDMTGKEEQTTLEDI